MKLLIDKDALEKRLIEVLCTRWLWLVAVWLPFPCLFLPFGFVLDEHDLWYLRYTSQPFLLAMLFYMPAGLVRWVIESWVGEGISLGLEYVLSFTQSLLLTWLVLVFKRRWVEDRPKPGKVAKPGCP